MAKRATSEQEFEDRLLNVLGDELLGSFMSSDDLKALSEEKQLDDIAKRIVENFGEDEVCGYIDEIKYSDDMLFKNYGLDPVGFCKKELNYILTDDMETMMRSILRYPVTIAISGTGVGKTIGSALISAWFFRCLPRSQVYVTAAPPAERNLKAKLWAELQTIIRNNRQLYGSNFCKKNVFKVQRNDDDRSFIIGVTIPQAGEEQEKESKFSGAHAPHLLFVLDEGDAIPDVVYSAIDGCMSGGFARLLVMFNPRRRSGAAYRKISNKEGNVVRLDALKHPNVVTGKDIIPGAVSREVTVKRIHKMTEPLRSSDDIDGTCFEVPSFLVGATAQDDSGEFLPPLAPGFRRVVAPQFFYKVLGEYPSQDINVLISEDWINAARSRWDMLSAQNGFNVPPEGIRPLLGMDVADDGGDYNTVVMRYGGYVQVPLKWRGLDIELSAIKAAQIVAQCDGLVLNVESDGLGASVAPTASRQWYWKCSDCGKTFIEHETEVCSECVEEGKQGKSLQRKHVNAKKIRVGSKPDSKKVIVDNDSGIEKAEFGTLRDLLWWSLREWLRTDFSSALPPSESLLDDLRVMTFEVIQGKLKVLSKDWVKKELGRSTDEADALLQTFYRISAPRVRLI